MAGSHFNNGGLSHNYRHGERDHDPDDDDHHCNNQPTRIPADSDGFVNDNRVRVIDRKRVFMI
ncbi:hypothetical protein RMSM_06230 [Rhodopirellula maiorica SM1]|uniref:Uncharacterized protein n=1 Tax=Rhodopirellula maiorica SM1 TaxID=1265738 RepID=M5RBT9_9BACT|nr:hypothetical protein RMSM_06230 [Rhodopirellula maiorica SM1]